MSVWDDLVAAAAGTSGALMSWDEQVTEGTEWRFESWPLIDNTTGLPIDLTGCDADLAIFDKASGTQLAAATTTGSAAGQFVWTFFSSTTADMAGRYASGRACVWQCKVTIPDTRTFWLWSASTSSLTILQEGAA